jgi:hypothetical protein
MKMKYVQFQVGHKDMPYILVIPVKWIYTTQDLWASCLEPNRLEDINGGL